jgi:hypothetical protein
MQSFVFVLYAFLCRKSGTLNQATLLGRAYRPVRNEVPE